MTTLLLLLLLCLFTLTSATSPSPPPPSPLNCTDELVAFSTCLPYVAVSPNNRSSDSAPPPTSQCCNDVSNSFSSGSALCLCYFLRGPNILGFPLDSARLLSLTSVCPLLKDPNSNATTTFSFSLATLCSGSAPLPPLLSITGPSITKPSNFSVGSPPPPFVGAPEKARGSTSNPEVADETPAQSGLSTFPTIISSATQGIHKLSWTFLAFTVYAFAFASRGSLL